MAEVDAVDICLPHPQHAAVAIAMARAGKHVLCEKPIALSVADAEAMAAESRRAGVVFMPFHNMRLGGTARRAIAYVRSGALGQPLLVRGIMAHGGPDRGNSRRQWFHSREAGGGAVLDLGPHLFDLLAACGLVPIRVRALLRRPADGEVETDGIVEAETGDGVLAVLTLSWSLRGGRESELTVQGSLGTMRWTMLREPPSLPGTAHLPLIAAIVGEPTPTVLEPEADDEPCAAFMRAIGGQPPALLPEDGVCSIRWIAAVYRSDAEGGAWVPFAPGSV